MGTAVLAAVSKSRNSKERLEADAERSQHGQGGRQLPPTAEYDADGDGDEDADDEALFAWALRRFVMGLVAAIGGIGADLLTESFCEESDFAKWFPGHALWHLLFACELLRLEK